MLNFEAFRDYVLENVLRAFPKEYEGAQVRIEKVAKANTERYGLTIRMEDVSITPNLYLEAYYDDYVNGQPLDNVMDNIAHNYQEAVKECHVPEGIGGSFSDWEYVRTHVVFDVVGREQNAEFNKNRPNRDYLDLSIIYRVVIGVDEKGIMSSVVTNDIIDRLGVTEEDLYQAAYENTKNLYEPKIANLAEVLGSMMGEDMGPCPLFMLSNDFSINGASMIIYDDVLQDLTDRVMGPLYDDGDTRQLIIFPSSRHEVLALNAADCDDIEYCQSMVQDINSACVALEDRLSNNIYLYDAMKHELSLATDVPNKRLDDVEQTKEKAI